MGEFTAALEACGAGQRGSFVTASVLLTDESDNVLLVRSADGHSWTIPSSVVADNEAPHDCVERLVSQQLGLTAVAGRLLVISWTPTAKDKNRTVVDFLFDVGAVHNVAALGAGADAGASGVFRFFSWEQAETMVSATLAAWLHSARSGREDDAGATYVPAVVEL
jgi:ADP-ribose pyrophosphatase YjhB (NUDIX family)